MSFIMCLRRARWSPLHMIKVLFLTLIRTFVRPRESIQVSSFLDPVQGEVVETLTGTKPSASTVSRMFHTLESEYEQWKTRKLASRYVYAFADGTYFTVI